MKTKMILITVIALCLLVGGMGCKDEPNVIDIYHTWKFQGFGNVTDSSFENVKLDCLIDSCEIYQNKLKLYYNQGQNYLLFNLLNK